jgi:serine protease Do
MLRKSLFWISTITTLLCTAQFNNSSAQFIMQTQMGENVTILVEFKAVAKDVKGKLTVESLAMAISTDEKPNPKAANIDLKVGDVVVSLNGKAVKSANDWNAHYEKLEDNASMKLVVDRDGKQIELSAVKKPLGSGGRQVLSMGPSSNVATSTFSMDESNTANIKVSKHLVGVAFDVSDDKIKVMAVMLAGREGDVELPFKTGDVILGLNGTFVKSFDELDTQLSKTEMGGNLRFAIERDGSRQFVNMNKSAKK